MDASSTESSALPEFDALWDYANPARTEELFRTLLPQAEASGDISYRLQLQTQIARALGLQRKFAEAHALLDEVEQALQPDHHLPRVRYLLERGRVYNSSRDAIRAKPLFAHATELARSRGFDGFAVDALHMLAIVESEPAAQLEWNFAAMKLAEASADESARKWLASLYNNIGWTYYEAGRFDEALDVFQKAVQHRIDAGKPRPLRVAHYAVGKTLRALKKYDEALAIQQQQLAAAEAAGEPDGFINEEIGECLLAKEQPEQAKPHLHKAFELLSKDEWLMEKEPQRIARLRELSGA